MSDGPTRVIVWFSCGAASAVAGKLAIEKYGPEIVELVYCDTSANEHPDNHRFLAEVGLWLKKPVKKIASEKFSTIEEVFAKRQYMSGVKGAPCTTELKKKPRFAYQKPGDVHVFGLTCEEKDRVREFTQNNHDLLLDWILIEHAITKNACFAEMHKAGIEIPAMYLLGYENNNCIGCVKAASPTYWTRVKRDFPEIFARRAKQSRELNVKLLVLHGRRAFLDELPDAQTWLDTLERITCGPECAEV